MGKIVFCMPCSGKTTCVETRQDFIDFDSYEELGITGDPAILLQKIVQETDKPVFCSRFYAGVNYDLAILLPKDLYIQRMCAKEGRIVTPEQAENFYIDFIAQIRNCKSRKFLINSYLSDHIDELMKIINE